MSAISQTKAGREFWLPLTNFHHRILLSVRGLDARWVFPPYGKSGHIECWNHKSVPGTLHSLRHTFATVGVEAGIPEEVIGRLLNQASKTITGQRYVKPKLDFLRSAMQVVVEADAGCSAWLSHSCRQPEEKQNLGKHPPPQGLTLGRSDVDVAGEPKACRAIQ